MYSRHENEIKTGHTESIYILYIYGLRDVGFIGQLREPGRQELLNEIIKFDLI